MKNLARTHFELLTSAKREANTESSRSSLTNQKTTSYPQPETEAQKRQKTQHFLYITYFSTVAIFFFFGYLPGIALESKFWEVAAKPYPCTLYVPRFRPPNLCDGHVALSRSNSHGTPEPRSADLLSANGDLQIRKFAGASHCKNTGEINKTALMAKKVPRLSANSRQTEHKPPRAGLDPAIFGLEIRRLVL